MTSDQHPGTDVFLARAERFAVALDRADGRWDAPTPCEGWTVRDVVDHVVSTQRDFLTGRGLLDSGSPTEATEDPAAAFRTHLAAVAEVLARDGVAEETYDGFFGPTTVGATLADFYGWDLAVHGWDVAVATGQPWEIGEEEAASLAATADGWGDMLHSEGICAAPVAVADDAPAGDRLLGRLGRDPGWRP